MKKIVLITIFIITCLTSFSFADDEVKDYVSLPNNQLVELPSLNATSSVYSIDDVYRILNSWNWPSGSSYAFVKDNTLHLDVNGLRSDVQTGNSRLLTISNTLANQDFSQLHSDLSSINTDLNSFNSSNHNDLTNVNSSLSTVHSDLSHINTNIISELTTLGEFKTANHNDLSLFLTSYNSIDWQTKSDSGVILRDKNFNTISSPGSYYPMYFTFTNLYPNPCIYRFHIYYTENYGHTQLNLQLGTYASGQFRPMLSDNIFYTYCASTLGYDIYVYSTGFAYTNQSINALTIKVDNGYLYQTNVIQQYIPFGNKDFNDTLIAMTNLSVSKSNNHIDEDIHYQNGILDVFKSLYASDDLIAAKQAQQSVEDASLSEFTGNGSASAKVSDITSTKNAQKAVKDSLDTGASASNVSNIVGVNSGFFSFFSQSISDSINNPSLSRQTRDINNPDYVPDLLSQNEREYWRLIQGDNR